MNTTDRPPTPAPQEDHPTMDAPAPSATPPRPRAARLVAAALTMALALTVLGLVGSPAGAAGPSAPKVLTSVGYDIGGSTGSHRIIWGEPTSTGGKPVTGWVIERWNQAKTIKLATYSRTRAQGPVLLLTGMADGVVFQYRVRAVNADGVSAFSSFEPVSVIPNTTYIHPFLNEFQLLSRQYQDFLGRAPTGAEANAELLAIDSPTTLATFFDGLLAKPERRATNRYRVIRLYLAYFDRAPDPSGLAYWEQQLANGKSLFSTSAFFAKSNEFKTTYGNLSNADFVDLVYQNVLDRSSAGDPGAAYWVTQLNTNKITRGDLMVGFSESAEGKKLRSGDAAVADLWLAMFHDEPSDELMAIYGRHILAGGTAGSLAVPFLRLFQYSL